MSRGDGTVREIVWKDIFPSLLLIRSLKIASGLRLLVLAGLALYLISLGWWLAGKIFHGREEQLLRSWIEQQSAWPWQEISAASGGDRLFGSQGSIDLQQEVPDAHIPDLAQGIFGGPVLRMWEKFSAPFVNLLHPRQTVTGLAYCILCCLWALAVLAVFGGAIARTAALALTRQELIGWRPALAHSWSKFGSYMAAPLLPLVAVLGGMLFLAIPSLIMRLDFGVLLAGLVWPVVLLAGLLMTITLVGVWFGWPLMWAALATESSDAFDGLNRSYAYVYQRPLKYLGYVIFAAVLGAIGTVLVNLFTGLVISASEMAVTWGAGADRMQEIRIWSRAGGAPGHMAAVGATLIAFWRNAVLTVGYGFQFSFFICSVTGIYLLLRRSVDATELDEVYLDEDQTYGHPSLEKDAAGVPGVPDDDRPTPAAASSIAGVPPLTPPSPTASGEDSATDVAGDE